MARQEIPRAPRRGASGKQAGRAERIIAETEIGLTITPMRSAVMLALQKYGLSVWAIAQKLEVGEGAVHTICQQARKDAAAAKKARPTVAVWELIK